MPADPLTPPVPWTTANPEAVGDHTERLIDAIHHVLAGTHLAEAAGRVPTPPGTLAAAAARYHHAGRQALTRHPLHDDWWQISLTFPDWARAEAAAATHVLPLLRSTEHASDVQWWFIRKHPCWRLRLRPRHRAEDSGLAAHLDALTTSGHLTTWRTGHYEPESVAFGGTAAMTAAHRLFHADSHAVLHHSGTGAGPLGRRELSMLLCTTLLRGAGLEWYEQGDAWHLVTEERPLPDDLAPDRLRGMTEQVAPLLCADSSEDGPLFTTGGPAAHAADWAVAFRTAGHTLGAAARQGTLERGLRRVLAYHIIFHWNRLGLPVQTQAALAWSARAAILHR